LADLLSKTVVVERIQLVNETIRKEKGVENEERREKSKKRDTEKRSN
jgi:hypothetical protein